MDKIAIGISACLLGHKVRYDGRHKAEVYIIDTLGRYCSWIPVCPEQDAGLGVPREAMHIRHDREGGAQLITRDSHRDVTPLMMAGIEKILSTLKRPSPAGFILKSRSPSCDATGHAPIYDAQGHLWGKGDGLFSRALKEHLPFLPISDEMTIHYPERLLSFLEEVATYHDFCLSRMRGIDPQTLRQFHTSHRLLVMSHAPRHLSPMDRLVDKAVTQWRPGWENDYYTLLKHAFRFPSTPHKHARCMAHVYRLLKPSLSLTAREECELAIDGLRTGAMSFPTIRAILATYITGHHIDTFIGDAYLFPPSWLQLFQEELLRSERKDIEFFRENTYIKTKKDHMGKDGKIGERSNRGTYCPRR